MFHQWTTSKKIHKTKVYTERCYKVVGAYAKKHEKLLWKDAERQMIEVKMDKHFYDGIPTEEVAKLLDSRLNLYFEEHR